MTKNSTPSRPSSIIRPTAFEPAPPTPTTLMRAPRNSSCISYFKSASSKLITLLPLSQHSPQESRGSLLGVIPRLQLRRIHHQTRDRGPDGIVNLIRPIAN